MAGNWKEKGYYKGVYIVFAYNFLTKKKRIIYIGSSSCVQKRIISHQYFDIWQSLLKKDEIVLFICREIEENLQLERWLIRRLKPLLNKQHNGN